MTVNGTIGGAGNLTKAGNGALLLNAPSTFSGMTTVSAGTLTLGNSSALQNSTLDGSGSGSLSFGTLNATTFGGLTGPGMLNLANSASSAISLNVGNNNSNTTFSGNLFGPGSLTKLGSGTLTLTGTNSYSGATTVAAGTLIVTTPTAIVNGASLNVGSIFSLAPYVPDDAGAIAGESTPNVVPEPSTLALFVAGAICFVSQVRRRRRSCGSKAQPFFQRRAQPW
jgi:autotransporter-associated beta strand protein